MKWIACFAVVLSSAIAGCQEERTDPGDVVEGEVETSEPVALTGEVEEWVGVRTFTLNSLGPDFEEELFVVSREPLSQTVYDDVQVQVTGVVRKCDVAALEKELGFEFPAEVAARLKDQPRCLLADEVRVTRPED